MNRTNHLAGDIPAIILLATYVIWLLVLPLLLPEGDIHALFIEHGPIEQLSVVAWLALGAVALSCQRPITRQAVAFALLTVFLAAREADLHKAFTADSILKTNYYRHSLAPLEEKLAAALVAAIFIALVLYCAFVVGRFLFLRGGWRTRGGMWLLFGSILVVAGKALDRAPAILLEDYGIAFGETGKLYTLVLEEGLELAHPLILAWAVWLSRVHRFLHNQSIRPAKAGRLHGLSG